MREPVGVKNKNSSKANPKEEPVRNAELKSSDRCREQGRLIASNRGNTFAYMQYYQFSAFYRALE